MEPESLPPQKEYNPKLEPQAGAASRRAGAAPLPSLRIQVGRLALDGFQLPPGGEGQVQAAFEAELARLFAAGELPANLRSGGARRELPVGTLRVGPWSDPPDLGRRIARALYEGLSENDV
ncbi:MAG TPA: hypothetical protein VF813_03290 [Anaerolineaceae bacterium]